MKKIMVALGIGLAVALTFSVGSKAIAMTADGASVGKLDFSKMFTGEVDHENYGKYRGYGELKDGTMPTVELIDEWIRKGYISEEKGGLEKKFIQAKSEDDKRKVYDEIIDSVKEEYRLSDSEVNKLKEAGYKKHARTLCEIYMQRAVDNGEITEEDARMEILYNSIMTEEEKEELLGLIVDRQVRQKEITKEQGDRLKAGGYDDYADNLLKIVNEEMIDELLKANYITEEEAKEYKETDELYKLERMYRIHYRYQREKS